MWRSYVISLGSILTWMLRILRRERRNAYWIQRSKEWKQWSLRRSKDHYYRTTKSYSYLLSIRTTLSNTTIWSEWIWHVDRSKMRVKWISFRTKDCIERNILGEFLPERSRPERDGLLFLLLAEVSDGYSNGILHRRSTGNNRIEWYSWTRPRKLCKKPRMESNVLSINTAICNAHQNQAGPSSRLN